MDSASRIHISDSKQPLRWTAAVKSQAVPLLAKLKEKDRQHPLEQGLTHTESRSRRKCVRRWGRILFLKNRRHAVGSCPLWTYSRISSSAAAAALCGGKVYV